MQSEKNEGREIPVITQYYFIIEGRLLEANKGEIAKYVGDSRKQEWKAFLKAQKIKWKREESLMKVLDFFTQN